MLIASTTAGLLTTFTTAELALTRSRPGHEVYALTPFAARGTGTDPPWAPWTAVGPGRTRSRGNTGDAQSLLVRFNAAY